MRGDGRQEGDAAHALRHLQRCAAVAQACGDATLQLQAQCSLGAALAQQGRHDEARPLQQHAWAAARRMPELPALQVAAAQGLADLECAAGRPEAARPLYEEALRLARASGDRPATLGPLIGLCGLAGAAGPLRAQWLQEAQALADELDSAPARRRVMAARAALPPA